MNTYYYIQCKKRLLNLFITTNLNKCIYTLILVILCSRRFPFKIIVIMIKLLHMKVDRLSGTTGTLYIYYISI